MDYRPFDKVPPELLSQILTLAWLGDEDYSPSRFRFPSVPLQVDRYFNHSANSTPIIWSYLLIDAYTSQRHIKHRIKRQSGTLPLELYITFTDVDFHDATRIIQETIMRSPSRFRKITLSYPRNSLTDMPFGSDFWDHLEPLTTLRTPPRVDCFAIWGSDEGFAIPFMFLPTFGPSIRSVSLYGCCFEWSEMKLPESLEALLVDEPVDSVDVDELLQCLYLSLPKSLRSLSLRWISIDWRANMFGGFVVMDTLEEFELEGLGSDEITAILNTVRTPNLHHLTLKNSLYGRFNEELAAVWGALRFPKLKKLTIGNFEGGGPVDLFRNLPESTDSLGIIGTSRTDFVMGSLLHPAALGFCRRLRHIVAKRVPLSSLVGLVGRCTSLQAFQVKFKYVADARGDLTVEESVAHFDRLFGFVTEWKVWESGRYVHTDKAIFLKFLKGTE